MDGRIWEALHVAHALERSGDVRPRPQPSRLASARLRCGISGAARHDHSWIFRARNPTRLPERTLVVLCVDLRRRPRAGAGLRRDGPSWHRPRRPAVLGHVRRRAGRASVESTLTREPPAAIEIARRAGRRLIICGIVQDARYFRRAGPAAHRWRSGELPRVGRTRPPRRSARSGSRPCCIRSPFAEPFGLSVVEAMACGTPVIAYPRGSMPEVVDAGVTGFSGRRGRGSGGRRSTRRRRWTARRSDGWPSVASRAARMVDDYLAVYRAPDRTRDEHPCARPLRDRFELGCNYWPRAQRDVHVARARSGRGARRLRAPARSGNSAWSESFSSRRTFCRRR